MSMRLIIPYFVIAVMTFAIFWDPTPFYSLEFITRSIAMVTFTIIIIVDHLRRRKSG